jgi:hypothetical protein
VPHRLTIRLDDTAWHNLSRMCEVTGVSATAHIQAVVEVAGMLWEQNDWRHPLEWEPSDLRDVTVRLFDAARRVDNDRRKRA